MKNRLLYCLLFFSITVSAQWKDHVGLYRFRNHVKIDSVLQLSIQNASGLATDANGNVIAGTMPSSSLPQYQVGFGSSSNTLSGTPSLIWNGNTLVSGGGTPNPLDRFFGYNSGNHTIGSLQSDYGVALWRAISNTGVETRLQSNSTEGWVGTYSGHAFDIYTGGTRRLRVPNSAIGDGSTTRMLTVNPNDEIGSAPIPSAGGASPWTITGDDVVYAASASAAGAKVSGTNYGFIEAANLQGVLARLQSNPDGAWVGTATGFPLDINTGGQRRLRIPNSPIGDGATKRILTIDDQDNVGSMSIPSGGNGSSLVVVNDANYTVAASVTDIVVSNQTAARTITLPVASSNVNRKLTIKNGGGGAYSINLSTPVRENTSTTTSSISSGYWITLVSDGIDWWIVANK